MFAGYTFRIYLNVEDFQSSSSQNRIRMNFRCALYLKINKFYLKVVSEQRFRMRKQSGFIYKYYKSMILRGGLIKNTLLRSDLSYSDSKISLSVQFIELCN